MEFGPCEESLLETQWGVAGRFHEQDDPVCIVEKDLAKGIDSVAVCGGESITTVGRCVGKMFARDRGSFEREASDGIDNGPVD